MHRLAVTVLTGITVVFGSAFMAEAQTFPNREIKFLFVNSCGECHGRKAQGSEQGPSLRNSDYIAKIKTNLIRDIIAKGVKTKDTRFRAGRYKEAGKGYIMEPYGENLAKDEIKTLADLVKSWNR